MLRIIKDAENTYLEFENNTKFISISLEATTYNRYYQEIFIKRGQAHYPTKEYCDGTITPN